MERNHNAVEASPLPPSLPFRPAGKPASFPVHPLSIPLFTTTTNQNRPHLFRDLTTTTMTYLYIFIASYRVSCGRSRKHSPNLLALVFLIPPLPHFPFSFILCPQAGRRRRICKLSHNRKKKNANPGNESVFEEGR